MILQILQGLTTQRNFIDSTLRTELWRPYREIWRSTTIYMIHFRWIFLKLKGSFVSWDLRYLLAVLQVGDRNRPEWTNNNRLGVDDKDLLQACWHQYGNQTNVLNWTTSIQGKLYYNKMLTFQNRLSLSDVVFEDILSYKLRMGSHK